MARAPRQQNPNQPHVQIQQDPKKAETIVSNGVIPSDDSLGEPIKPADVLSNDGLQGPPAVDFEQVEADKQNGPKVTHFVVTKGGFILEGGNRTRMHEGKVFNDLNYDPNRLRQQGIRFDECAPDGTPL